MASLFTDPPPSVFTTTPTSKLVQLAANVPRDRGASPYIFPEMAPRGGARTYTGASGEKVVAPDYGAEAEAGSPTAGWSKNDASNLRSALRDSTYSKKALEEKAAKTQQFYETQTVTPQGYAWINGRLTQVGPDKWGNPPPAMPVPAPAQQVQKTWLDILRGQK